jgi:6-phosphofructo-2-kinase
MLQRSMQTAEFFDPDDYDIKHIRFLNEINSGVSSSQKKRKK